MIRLSQSSIKDFLECSQRFWYRTNMKEMAKVNKHVVFGSIAHEAIEKFTEPGPAIQWAWAEWDKRMGGPYTKSKKPPRGKCFSRMLGNYFYTIVPKIQGKKMNKIEHFFRLPWEQKIIDDDESERIASFYKT